MGQHIIPVLCPGKKLDFLEQMSIEIYLGRSKTVFAYSMWRGGEEAGELLR